jgi:hypothetical protein
MRLRLAAVIQRRASALAREYGVSRATVYNVRWTEPHIVAVDDLYRRYGMLGAEHPEVQALARQLKRTPTAVAARMNNLRVAHSEPSYPGSTWHFTKLDRKVADR